MKIKQILAFPFSDVYFHTAADDREKWNLTWLARARRKETAKMSWQQQHEIPTFSASQHKCLRIFSKIVKDDFVMFEPNNFICHLPNDTHNDTCPRGKSSNETRRLILQICIIEFEQHNHWQPQRVCESDEEWNILLNDDKINLKFEVLCWKCDESEWK